MGVQVGMIRVYKSGIHRGEEPILLGNENSGMINFSGCHLACRFCYTPETSRFLQGQAFSPEQFYLLMTDLAHQGAGNINLITPSHHWSKIHSPLEQFRQIRGQIPILLKTGGAEPLRLVEKMLELVQIWIPDLKIWNSQLAVQEGLPAHYGPLTLEGIQLASSRLIPEWDMQKNVLRRGVLVRHLLMPGCEADSGTILEELSKTGFKGVLNLMTRFIEPVSHQLIPYPKKSLMWILQKAEGLGLKTLVDGKWPATAKK